jgi:hypothetical protein
MGRYQNTCVSFFVIQANNFDILAGVSGQLTTFFSMPIPLHSFETLAFPCHKLLNDFRQTPSRRTHLSTERKVFWNRLYR